jgi:spore coat protein CotH
MSYIDDYNKANYTSCSIRIKKEMNEILAEYCDKMHLSKATLIQKCVLYCYDNSVNIAAVDLPKSDKSGK